MNLKNSTSRPHPIKQKQIKVESYIINNPTTALLVMRKMLSIMKKTQYRFSADNIQTHSFVDYEQENQKKAKF